MRGRCPYDGDRLDSDGVCPTCERVFNPPPTVYDDPGDEQLDLQLDEAFFDPGGEPE